MRGNITWEHDANTDPYSGPTANFEITKIIVDEIMGNGQRQILFTTQKDDWFPSQLGILSADGELLKYYWNPGFIYQVLLEDFDLDGAKELVIYSVNNNLGAALVGDSAQHPAIVYILSAGEDFTGQAFPDLVSDLPVGREFNGWIAVFHPYEVLGVELSLVEEKLIEVRIIPGGGYIFLDSHGNFQRSAVSDYWQSEYGEQSPLEFICFLTHENEDWFISWDVDVSESCPWYGQQ